MAIDRGRFGRRRARRRRGAQLLAVLPLAMALLTAGAWTPLSRAADEIVTIGTGSVLGVYFPVGGAICRTVNPHTPFHSLRCLVDSTAGSLDNVRRLETGLDTFGLVQSDVQWQAIHGEPPFDRSFPGLRAVFALYPETAVLALGAGSGIETVGDLPRARLSLGPPGSGTRAAAAAALRVLGLAEGDLGDALGLGAGEVLAALAQDRIDGFLMLVGHPSPLLDTQARTGGLRLLPLDGAGRDALVSGSPYYGASEIPGGLYAGVPDPVPTFGVTATLMTHENVPDRVVYGLAKSVLLDLARFRDAHPALGRLTPERLLDGISAPLHPGACAALREFGELCSP